MEQQAAGARGPGGCRPLEGHQPLTRPAAGDEVHVAGVRRGTEVSHGSPP